MSAKLTVGLSKKLGLPDFRSIGAHCEIELVLDPPTGGGPDDLSQQARQLYAACRRAVEEELARQLDSEKRPDRPLWEEDRPLNGSGQAGSPQRLATAKQVRALSAMTFDRGIDLGQFVRERFGKDRPGELTISEASKLIDELNHPPMTASRS